MHTLRRFGTSLGVSVFLGLTACARNAPMDTLEPDGPIARDIDGMFNLVFWIAAAVFVLVQGILVVAMVRFRERRDQPTPRQTHGDTRLEIGWTIAPALLLAILAVPTVAGIFRLSAEPKGDDVLTVNVVGRQWWWEYDYEGLDVKTANELHIPVGRPVLLKLTSADVVHAYWVPKLAGKQDVIPGRVNHMTIEADRPGQMYLGQCAEFCAMSHANMQLRVYTHTEDEFRAWVREQTAPAAEPTDQLALEGMRAFMSGSCVNCHAIGGTQAAATTAPDLTHFASRETFGGATFPNTREELTRWLLDPPAMKPGSKMPNYVRTGELDPDDIPAIVAYLESLK